MELTKEQLEDIAAMAGLMYSPEDIAKCLLLQKDVIMDWLDDESSPFYQAYWPAYYENDMKLRLSINKLALNGSTPAQASMLKFIDRNKLIS
jgi:hypothetical protein